MLLFKAYHLALVYFPFYFARIANGALYHINDASSVVLSALSKQPQVWILFPVCEACCCMCSCREVSPLDCCPVPWLQLHTASSWLFSLTVELDSLLYCVLEALPPHIWINCLPVLSKLQIKMKTKMIVSRFSHIYSPCNNINILGKLLRRTKS